ncbi:MAG: methyltransferase domain-containing protein [Candidatus Rokuibacteriota bacterium]
MTGEPRVEAFDSVASTYDAWYETPVGRLVDRLEKQAVFALVEPQRGDLVLDLSCGTGIYALALAQRGLRVVGADLSEPMLRLAQAKARQTGVGIAFVQADGSTLPFRPGTFDLVTVILGLEFAAEPVKTLEEIRRILKPGATLVVAILNRSGLWTLWRRFKRLFVPSVWRHARFLGLEELRRHMETHGFRQLRWRGAVHFLPIFTGRAARCLERCEAFGARWMPARATFLAMSGRRA